MQILRWTKLKFSFKFFVSEIGLNAFILQAAFSGRKSVVFHEKGFALPHHLCRFYLNMTNMTAHC